MNNLLVGNGINIQFGKSDYGSQQIVLRILKNCDRDDFPTHIIIDCPHYMKSFIGKLYLESRSIINGMYDSYVTCTAEKNSLAAFKEHYKDKIGTLKVTDIAFEDYYLIHDLVCHKLKITNPEQFNVRKALEISYLYSIYNDGKINELYKLFPDKFITFLLEFDSIFTTNYDSNVELSTHKTVYHIHGDFNQIDDVYNADSFRNQLPDAPIKNIEIDENYFYLYSNAITTHCGEYKEFQIHQATLANQSVEKMAEAYRTDPKIKEEIDSWTTSSNSLTANLGLAIQIKAQNPYIKFSEDYHFDKLENMDGCIEILGLSPWNDFHIFEAVDNANIEKCIYYYNSEKACSRICQLLPRLNRLNRIELKNVKLFWEKMNEK